MSEHEQEEIQPEAEEQDANGGFGRDDERTAKMPALKRMGIMKQDKELHEQRKVDEEE